MKKYFYLPKIMLAAAIGCISLFSSCDVLNQVTQMTNLTKCDFRLASVQELSLAGVNVQNVNKISDLSLMDGARLAKAVAAQQLPLTCTLNIEAKNPNTSAAGMTKIDWILLIDDIEMTQGQLDQQVTIPANNGTAIIPMKINVDLQKALSGKSADAILNFGMNLAGSGNKPTRFTLRMKPTIAVNGFPLTYPGYLDVKTEYGSQTK